MSQDKRARQHENRRKRLAAEAEAKRKEARRKQIRSAAIAAVFVVIAGIGFVLLTDSPDDTPAVTTTLASGSTATTLDVVLEEGQVATQQYLAFRQQPVACGGSQPPPAQEMTFTEPEDLGIDPTSKPTAVLTTSCGDVTIELDPSVAPETVNSFVFLAEQGYFDGTISHRIIPGFMVQMGDPTASGTGDPGYVVPDEFPEDGFVYDRGVVAMANAGVGSTGSQFFMMLGTSGLGPTFSAFGTVVDGFDALDAMATVQLAPRGNEVSLPLETVYIESVDIER
ncbi:MAG: peptidylprolyl isomerase [Acidimicrobiia bacterium]|nr:peptidylprolyl isomerase [Acidimicrobiia bacterium]